MDRKKSNEQQRPLCVGCTPLALSSQVMGQSTDCVSGCWNKPIFMFWSIHHYVHVLLMDNETTKTQSGAS